MAPGVVANFASMTTKSPSPSAPANFPSNADTEEYAESLDAQDPLGHFRDRFIIPPKDAWTTTSILKTGPPGDRHNDGERGVYFCGNSLGLQPKCTSKYIEAQLQTWATIAVAGHFTQLEDSPLKPWQSMADFAAEQSCRLVGALENEVAVANTLTVNLHLLMASFYRPTPTRNKILLEWKAFPSDHYAIESQISWHGYEPDESMILVEPDQDHIISTTKIIDTIDKYANEIALILLPGVQYYTGQLLDIARITEHAHQRGILIGWDLAHAAGNVPLNLHEWGVDFAAWCTYKYQNAGPGAIAGLFVHERHGKVEHVQGQDRPAFRHRLTGWYSGDQVSRFNMDNKFNPIPGAGGFQISNPSAVDLASLCASLSIFNETSMDQLRTKSLRLTAYLEHLLLHDHEDAEQPFCIITPFDPSQRGAQLSLLLRPGRLEHVGRVLKEAGIVVDQRKPDVIRIAPVPLYNCFRDVWRFAQVFREAVKTET